MTTSPFVLALLHAGVPLDTVALLLVLPIVATVISTIRLIIGFKAFGVYTSLLIAFVFLGTGIVPGLLLYFVTLIVGVSMRALFRRIRLLHLPRMAMVMTTLVMVVLGIFALADVLGVQELLTVPVWALVILIAFVEEFVTAQIESGTSSAVYLSFETCIIALLSSWLFTLPQLRNLMLSHPEALLLVFPLNLLLGRWTGLRLIEYIRFKEIWQRMP